MNNRKQLDITFANMFSNEEYRRHYVFYAHVLAQCKIVLDDSVPVAGVAFVVNKYVLCINPEGFNKYTTTERMAILAHEALHIVNNHQDRKGQRVHELFNIATDCAINQLLPKGHLPE
jgi:predicted metal-dependent peptidase